MPTKPHTLEFRYDGKYYWPDNEAAKRETLIMSRRRVTDLDIMILRIRGHKIETKIDIRI